MRAIAAYTPILRTSLLPYVAKLQIAVTHYQIIFTCRPIEYGEVATLTLITGVATLLEIVASSAKHYSNLQLFQATK